jgi:hypothetical protein
MAEARFCPVCGQPSPGGAVHPEHLAPAASVRPPEPGTTPATKPKSEGGCTAVGCMGLVAAVVLLWIVLGGNGGSGATPDPATPSHLTGKLLGWDPVDQASGYARFSVTNSGTADAVAKCSITVKNDFGDSGFDFLVGLPVPAGETVTSRIPLSVGKGSFTMNRGSVTGC